MWKIGAFDPSSSPPLRRHSRCRRRPRGTRISCFCPVLPPIGWGGRLVPCHQKQQRTATVLRLEQWTPRPCPSIRNPSSQALRGAVPVGGDTIRQGRTPLSHRAAAPLALRERRIFGDACTIGLGPTDRPTDPILARTDPRISPTGTHARRLSWFRGCRRVQSQRRGTADDSAVRPAPGSHLLRKNRPRPS
jgi:hypothetical protein